MIVPLFALLLLQAQPILRSAPQARAQVPIATLSRAAKRQAVLADGRALLAHAETFRSGYAPAPGQPTRAELDAAVDQLKSELDSMSEMSEVESMRLQMAMDRLSKMMETLSNIMKKAGDTDASIVANMK